MEPELKARLANATREIIDNLQKQISYHLDALERLENDSAERASNA